MRQQPRHRVTEMTPAERNAKWTDSTGAATRRGRLRRPSGRIDRSVSLCLCGTFWWRSAWCSPRRHPRPAARRAHRVARRGGRSPRHVPAGGAAGARNPAVRGVHAGQQAVRERRERPVDADDRTAEPEIYHYNVTIDGVRTIDPNNPDVKTGSTPSTISSILEVRGSQPAFYDAQTAEHGEVRSLRYKSTSLGTERKLTVYTPPAYQPRYAGAISGALSAARRQRGRNRLASSGPSKPHPRQPPTERARQAVHRRHAVRLRRSAEYAGTARRQHREIRPGSDRRCHPAHRVALSHDRRPRSSRPRRVVDGRRRSADHRPEPPRAVQPRRRVQRGGGNRSRFRRPTPASSRTARRRTRSYACSGSAAEKRTASSTRPRVSRSF